MSKRRQVLKKGELRELGRMKKTFWSLNNFLGGKSEEAAKTICSELLKEGIINEFWCIPTNSALDRQGIDMVCETYRGFFFINVKKSSSGVNYFLQQRKMLKEKNNTLHIIYPWRVIPELNWQEEAKTDLEKMLNKESPSCDILPENIKKELASPTLPRHTPAPQQPKMPTSKQRLEALRKKLSPVIKSKKAEYLWEVTISAMVKNEPVEIKVRGEKHETAELVAYEELSKLVNR